MIYRFMNCRIEQNRFQDRVLYHSNKSIPRLPSHAYLGFRFTHTPKTMEEFCFCEFFVVVVVNCFIPVLHDHNKGRRILCFTCDS